MKRESIDRVLATVLFTDIVDSTETGPTSATRAWKELVAAPRDGARDARAVAGHRDRHGGRRLLRDVRRSARARPVREGGDRAGPAPRSRGACGLHTGECEMIDSKGGGLAVSIGARVAASQEPRRCSSPRR